MVYYINATSKIIKTFFRVNVTGRRKEEIMESLLLLGRLFDYNTNDEYRFLEAQEVLDRYFDETKREYSPYLLLRQV